MVYLANMNAAPYHVLLRTERGRYHLDRFVEDYLDEARIVDYSLMQPEKRSAARDAIWRHLDRQFSTGGARSIALIIEDVGELRVPQVRTMRDGCFPAIDRLDELLDAA